MSLENNGRVALRGGMARTRNYWIHGEFFERRCEHCNQREGDEWTSECYGQAKVPDPRPPRDAFNYPVPLVHPPHDFQLLSPLSIEVPLTLSNRSIARYNRSRQLTSQGIRIYNYSGERGFKE